MRGRIFHKSRPSKSKHFLVEIWKNIPLLDPNWNQKMEPDIRPEPDFAGYLVGSKYNKMHVL
jgi:hypothetical protein